MDLNIYLKKKYLNLLYNKMSKKSVQIYGDRILEVKTLATMRKYFLSDVTSNSDKLSNQTLGKTVKEIQRFGVKDLKHLYNQIKPLLYGNIPNNSFKKIKTEANVFNFGDDIFQNQNSSIINYEAKVSSIPFKRVAQVIEMNLNEKKFKKIEDFDMMKKHIKHAVFKQLEALMIKFTSMKIILGVEASLQQEGNEEVSNPALFQSGSSHTGNGKIVNKRSQFEKFFNDSMEIIRERIEEYAQNGSGWKIDKFLRLFIKVVKYQPFTGSSFIELPEYLNNKKCIINIKNNDTKCFMYSILCALHFDDISKDHQRVSKYKPYENELKFDNIEFPVSVDDIAEFEKMNNIGINVFTLNEEFNKDDELSQHFNVIYFHTAKNERKIIDLLLIEDEDKSHYCWIKNRNAFIRTKNTHDLFHCGTCFRVLRTKEALENHVTKNQCEFLLEARKVLPNPKKLNPRTKKADPTCHLSMFKNTQKQLKVPFVIYADGESILRKANQQEGPSTKVYQNHQVFNMGCKFVSEFPDIIQDEYKEFTGENCMIEFLTYVFEMQDKVLEVCASENQIEMNLTKEEEKLFQKTEKCHICCESIEENQEKVRDHCHLTGKFRGAAHNSCNLNYKYKGVKLPVIFHNLKGYDSHFILQYIGQFDKKKISVIDIHDSFIILELC